jgi:hypothetical protein
LKSFGAPESITGRLPQELRDLDVSAVIKMFSNVDLARGETGPSSVDQSVERSIQWLPIIRDGN